MQSGRRFTCEENTYMFSVDRRSFLHQAANDRKSTRLNSSHSQISYAVFCLKKKENCITVICFNSIVEVIHCFRTRVMVAFLLVLLRFLPPMLFLTLLQCYQWNIYHEATITY